MTQERLYRLLKTTATVTVQCTACCKMKGLVLATFAALVACSIGVPSVVRFAVDREVS